MRPPSRGSTGSRLNSSSNRFALAKEQAKEKLQETRDAARAANTNPPSDAQRKMFFALMKQRHGDDRDGMMRDISDFLERPITSSNEITKDEMSDFIDAVQGGYQEAI